MTIRYYLHIFIILRCWIKCAMGKYVTLWQREKIFFAIGFGKCRYNDLERGGTWVLDIKTWPLDRNRLIYSHHVIYHRRPNRGRWNSAVRSQSAGRTQAPETGREGNGIVVFGFTDL